MKEELLARLIDETFSKIACPLQGNGVYAEIKKAVMSIVTDSSGDRPENVFAIHKLVRPEAELDALYEANQGQYKALKEALVADIEAVIAPMREKRDSITDADVRAILEQGAAKARERAAAKMADVREKVGILN